jgi:hypothetical protein
MALENLIMSILNIIYALIMPMCVTYVTGRDDREADCAALEMLCRLKPTVGSNPTLSANTTF